MIQRLSIIILAIIIISGCSNRSNKRFDILSSKKTGIEFNNAIVSNDIFHILNYEYFYNGGGVGIADFNNDNLPDIFFSGNIVDNKLYLNKGKMKFQDVSSQAGIEGQGIWCTGIAVVDINNDGFQDIYVCASAMDGDKRKNLFYIHQGLDKNGIPIFKNMADEYGVADDGYSVNAVFFDYDNDQDLDLYVLTNLVETQYPNIYRYKVNNGTSPSIDRMYRNNGDQTFTNATVKADFYYEGYGHGISILDINEDGWKDVYITNDYLTNDVLYINNKDGSFTNEVSKYIKHQSYAAMGNDVADINNDGLPDIFSLEKIPGDNKGLKQNMPGNNYLKYINNEKYGYDYQYHRNVLQLNNGISDNGIHNFSDIGFFANVFASHWSWAPLFIDLDNDGNKDLFISNGFPKDPYNLDYLVFKSRKSLAFHKQEMLQTLSEAKIQNYIFRNNADLTFTDKTWEWGSELPSFSNGAAFADLDNDGDIDLVTNNINDPAFIYKNNLVNESNDSANFVRIKLVGHPLNVGGIGTKITLWSDGGIQYTEYSPYRGYCSTMEPYIHFGIGSATQIDSIKVVWPDSKTQVLTRVNINEVNQIAYGDSENIPEIQAQTKKYRFTKAKESENIQYRHRDDLFVDFNIQPTLPHQFSQQGPSLSVGDIDGNGFQDLFIGGSLGYGGTFFLQSYNGSFEETYFQQDDQKNMEDLGTLLFDADSDGDLDLYIVSGSYEQEVKPIAYTDRIYINDGSGNYEKAKNALPDFVVSGSCVKGADYDQDGDIDLFIGGGVQHGKYPLPSNSYILENVSTKDNILFEDATFKVCPDLEKLGLVSDALWTDYNNDFQIDLIIVGEWMPIMVFENQQGKLINKTSASGTENYSGIWKSISGADFDNDGDIDYVAGNLGKNSFLKASETEPIVAFVADFDNKGSTDVIIASYYQSESGERKLFPVHSLDDMAKQINSIKDMGLSYADYGKLIIQELFTPDQLANADSMSITCLSSCYIENKGNGIFKVSELPLEVQLAPVNGILTQDINEDGLMDILMVGNDYGNSLFWGRLDAFNGLYLLNNGNNSFTTIPYRDSGFFVPGDAKALVQIPTTNNQSLVIASQNQDSLKVFKLHHSQEIKFVSNDAAWALLHHGNQERKIEFYYGNSYLSQSSRTFLLPDDIDSISYINYKGRKIN